MTAASVVSTRTGFETNGTVSIPQSGILAQRLVHRNVYKITYNSLAYAISAIIAAVFFAYGILSSIFYLAFGIVRWADFSRIVKQTTMTRAVSQTVYPHDARSSQSHKR